MKNLLQYLIPIYGLIKLFIDVNNDKIRITELQEYVDKKKNGVWILLLFYLIFLLIHAVSLGLILTI